MIVLWTNPESYLEWFENNFKHLYTEVNLCDHSSDMWESNYHKEGSVLNHTRLVLGEAIKDTDKVLLHIAALLHDIGKPYCRNIKENSDKVVFYDHDNYSAYLAIDVIKKYYESIDDPLNSHNLVEILYLINYHMLRIKNKKISNIYDVNNFFGFGKSFDNNFVKMLHYDNVGRKAEKEYLDFRDSLNLAHDLETADIPDFEYDIEYKKNSLIYRNKNSTKFSNNSEGANLTLLMGIPASGKTTYSEKLKENGYKVFCRDDVIMELGAFDEYDKNWKTVNQEEVSRIHENRIKDGIKNEEDLVIDETNMSIKSRNRKINLLHNRYLKSVNIKVFLLSLEEVLKRNSNRSDTGKYITPKVYEKMLKNFQMPVFSEGFNEIEFIFE